MTRTRLSAWACRLAFLLAAGGAAAAGTAPARSSPVQPEGKQEAPEGEKPRTPQKVVVTAPLVTDVVVAQQYAGRVRARRHIEVRALVTGVIAEVPVKEGQEVKQGDVLFKMAPNLYKAKLEAELAEVAIAKVELNNAKKLFAQKVVAQQEVALCEARLARAEARAKLAEVELSFTVIKAPFDGLVGRLQQQQGSLAEKGDALTTLSDGSVAWVYFHVPEARYLEYVAGQGKRKDPSRLELADSRIELVLADDSTFNQTAGNVVTVEGLFSSETGNIAFRADFPNPDRVLRHGQTGTIRILRTLHNATVVPQRATFEVLDRRRYVYLVGKDGVARQREIAVRHEVGDLFVVGKGLDVNDRIVLDGVRRVRDGDKVESVFRKPEEAYGRPKAGREK